jgi:hypothetical protein
MSPPADASTLALSLVSHTNVGKTTLARTLLGRDIGEVRDEAHVTLAAEPHLLAESEAGDRLELWDTPGFGDSARLARRMAQAGNPLGWFMTEVWDRLRDRAFWSTQHAVRHVIDRADVVLYLVNAAETPQDAGYLEAELKILALVAKPVVVLLNQLGPPRPPADEARELERWTQHLAAHPIVRRVLALDAFARCWVQETSLLDAVAEALPASRAAAFARLREAWLARRRASWAASMRVLAERLAQAAHDREGIAEGGWADRLKEVGKALGVRRSPIATPRERAMQTLGLRFEAAVRLSTDRLIELHGLDGHATSEVLRRLAEHFAARQPVDERKAAVLGGLATGALAGLKADLASGGLTLGGGLLAGGIVGALGAAGLARGYNLVRGVATPTLAWSEAALDEFTRAALLGYLAVIHHGRGRGPWADAEPAAFWAEHVDAVLAARLERLHAMWQERTSTRLVDRLAEFMAEASRELLLRLYPQVPAESL